MCYKCSKDEPEDYYSELDQHLDEMKKEQKHYIFYWLDGTISKGEGNDVSHAFTMLGYGAGAIRALDFHEEATEPSYKWNREKHDWIKK